MKRLLALLSLAICLPALSVADAYRVELIIFENLAVDAETTEIEGLRSFSQFPALEEANLPDDLLAVEQKGSYMDAVWRRLRSSKSYRPLLFSAWQQNQVDYYPPIRLHNDVLLDTQLLPPSDIMIANLSAEDPLAAYLSSFYQLDGTVQLKRSRFLHLNLDLEYRQVPARDSAAPGFFEGDNPAPSTGNQSFMRKGRDLEESKTYRQHELKQNRQIRTGKVQYFDTPAFGVLVFVSAIRE